LLVQQQGFCHLRLRQVLWSLRWSGHTVRPGSDIAALFLFDGTARYMLEIVGTGKLIRALEIGALRPGTSLSGTAQCLEGFQVPVSGYGDTRRQPRHHMSWRMGRIASSARGAQQHRFA
jgi:hypothetical protein